MMYDYKLHLAIRTPRACPWEQSGHHLGISIEETIVVGDADSDKEAIEVAGLSVAMGNAKESIKEISDVIVSDNDHDGCAEVIEKYLLEE